MNNSSYLHITDFKILIKIWNREEIKKFIVEGHFQFKEDSEEKGALEMCI